MKILIIGRGGREHAIAWKLKESKRNPEIFVAPGNAGIAQCATCIDIDELDNEKLLDFAKKEKIDLTIVGPEVALSNGVVDVFTKNGLQIFGASQRAAIIESSKAFSKELMKKYDIPTAAYATFDNYEQAMQYLQKTGTPIVIKYDGLAAGKGVVVALTMQEAEEALKDMLLDKKYGNASVVIEEYLEGTEFSLMAFVNGEMVLPMVVAQDHKRVYDNDKGPNTGGMGAYSPVPVIHDADVQFAMQYIMQPVAQAMMQENRRFVGVLYGGLMLTKQGVKVIEFNARFGDPETEVVLPRMQSDLVEVILSVLEGKHIDIVWKKKVALGVVMASEGYPNGYQKGFEIQGAHQELVFHMGTQQKGDKLIANGGRVLMVVGMGNTLKNAKQAAYEKVSKIHAQGLFYRKDIGYQIIEN